jgi:hypothetical protein
MTASLAPSPEYHADVTIRPDNSPIRILEV